VTKASWMALGVTLFVIGIAVAERVFGP